MSVASQPRSGNAKSDVTLISIIAGIWVIPWALLAFAAKIAGGNPKANPIDFIDIGTQIKRYNQDGGIVWWHLVNAYGPINPFLFWFVMVVAAATLIGLPVFIVLSGAGVLPMNRLAGMFAPGSLKRTSHWANAADLRSIKVKEPRKGCFILGRRGNSLIATEPETSVLVIGPTRSGKTSGLVMPNLFEWQGPAIVTSTKSELVDITGGYRQNLGPVYVYDPTGEISDQYQGVTWSPITGCDKLDYAWMMASWLTAGMQTGNSGRSDNDWTHWAESGKLLVAPLLYTAASTNRTIIDVRNWILAVDVSTPMAILQDMLAQEKVPTNSDPERAINMLMSIDQRPEKERGTVFSTVTRLFSVFVEKNVAASATSSRFNPEEFLRRNGTLYLCTPRQAPERIASLFVGILMTAVTKAYELAQQQPGRHRLDPELGLFLDELANIVPVEELPSLASQGAGRGVMLMSIVQDMSQLKARYGQDKSNSILNNHPCKIVLPGISDPETTEQISKLVGREEYTDVSVSKGGDGKTSKSFSLKAEQMATPDALRQLKEGTAIVLYKGKPPLIVSLRPWFQDAHFTELSQRRFFKNAEYVSYQRPA